jgi:uncharacterized membrane protein YqjE
MSSKTQAPVGGNRSSASSARSTGELLMDVADDLRMLLRKEIELARIELMEGLKAQLVGVGIIALALLSILPALLFGMIALAFWLPFSSEVSFAIVAGGLSFFTLAGIGIGIWVMRRRRVRLRRSIDSIKEDVRWARDQLTR